MPCEQIISFFIGDGFEDSCKHLWHEISHEYLRCDSYNDGWISHPCLSRRRHPRADKQNSLKAHAERWNNTLRQRISQLTRRTLSPSKQKYMLNLYVKLFDYRLNLSHTT